MSKVKILVMEDEPDILRLISRLLETAGMDVVGVDNSPDALMIAQETEDFDLAVLDVRMPGMSGLEVADELRDKTSIPYLFVSAERENDVIANALASGAQGYIIKPFENSLLVAHVKNAVERSKVARKQREHNAGLLKTLSSSRAVSELIGRMLGAFNYDDQEQASRDLIRVATDERKSVIDLADDIMAAVLKVNEFDKKIDLIRLERAMNSLKDKKESRKKPKITGA